LARKTKGHGREQKNKSTKKQGGKVINRNCNGRGGMYRQRGRLGGKIGGGRRREKEGQNDVVGNGTIDKKN